MADNAHVVITIARQLGAGGSALGQRLAARLELAYLDRDILRIAAEKTGYTAEQLEPWDERASRLWDRLVDSFAIGPAEGIYPTVMSVPEMRDQRLFEMEGRVMREVAARRGAVIIGRAGFWVMRKHRPLVRLFLHSPPESRLAQVRQAFNLSSDAEATAMIEQVDRQRERFVYAMTGSATTDARNFDLSINTQTVSLDSAEDMVCKLVEAARARS